MDVVLTVFCITISWGIVNKYLDNRYAERVYANRQQEQSLNQMEAKIALLEQEVNNMKASMT